MKPDGMLARHAPPIAVSLYLLALSLLGTPSTVGVWDLAGLVLLYGLLAWTLDAGVRWLAGFGPGGLALGSLAAGAVLAWHMREQLWIPMRPLSFGLAVVAAALLFGLSLRMSGAGSQRHGPLRVVGLAALLLGALAATYHASPTFRWHLLRHNKLLGTPAFLAFSTPVAEVQRKLWSAHPAREVTGEVAPPLPRGAGAPQAADRPHLVFLMLDTLRADALAAYGAERDLMPRLDRVAAEAWVLADVAANAPWTRPSIASMFTGLLPEEHGAVDRPDRLNERLVTLAERLQRRGYRTEAYVANVAAAGREAGFADGFDDFVEIRSPKYAYARAETVVDAAVRALRRPRGNRPLFLYVHLLDPHTPYLSGGPGATRHSQARASYDRELAYLDGQVARLLESVHRSLEGRVVLFVTSDHGEEFGEHAERGHGHSLYPEVLHVPALLDLGDGGGGRIEARLEGRDFHDLLLAAVDDPDLDPTAWAAARSRDRRYASVYLTTGDPSLHRPYLHSVSMRGVQVGDRHLIWSGYGNTWELYDVERDPEHLENLARRDPAARERLSEALDGAVDYWARRTPLENSAEVMEQLKALGYVVE